MTRPENAAEESLARLRRPWLAGLLSLWQPGLGQLYCGRWKRGALAWACGLALMLGLAWSGLLGRFWGLMALVAILLFYYLMVLIDSVRLARGVGALRLRWFNRWYVYVLLGALLGLGVQPLRAVFPVRSFYVPAASMEPTIQFGDRLMADLTWWRDRQPDRGALVLHEHPERPGQLMMKRVVATAGETVEIRDKKLLVDGEPVEPDPGVHRDPEIYPPSAFNPATRRDNFGPLEVPEGHLFLLGDNRDQSYDSRFWGPLPGHLVRGRPLYVYWAEDRSRIGTRLR